MKNDIHDFVFMIYESSRKANDVENFACGYPVTAIAYATREKAKKELKAMLADMAGLRRWTEDHTDDGTGYFDYQRSDGSVFRRWIVGVIVLD